VGIIGKGRTGPKHQANNRNCGQGVVFRTAKRPFKTILQNCSPLGGVAFKQTTLVNAVLFAFTNPFGSTQTAKNLRTVAYAFRTQTKKRAQSAILGALSYVWAAGGFPLKF
jgi:hypothetical protein